MRLTTSITGTHPHSTDEIKSYLRITHNAEDGSINSIYAAAIAYVEGRTRRNVYEKTITLTGDHWPGHYCHPTKTGGISIVSATYRDADGHTISFDQDIRIDQEKILLPDQPADFRDRIEIIFEAAPHTNDALRNAILMLTAQWFENRGDQNIRGIPHWVEKVCGTYAYQAF